MRKSVSFYVWHTTEVNFYCIYLLLKKCTVNKVCYIIPKYLMFAQLILLKGITIVEIYYQVSNNQKRLTSSSQQKFSQIKS